MKKLTFLLALLCVSLMGWAESNLCEVQPAHPSNPSKPVLLSWNTAENGDVVVTIAPGAGVSEATFRNNGFTGNVDQFKVLSGDGFTTEENASKYFYEKANVEGETSYTLYRTGEYNLPSPCQIKYVPGAVEWIADEDNNGYDNSGESVIVYNYGTICGSTLDAPEISVSSEGVVTFEAVDGATSYKAYIYQGSSYIVSLDVASGELMSYVPYLAGSYQVRLRAFNDTQYSDFSDSFNWEIVSDNISGNLPPSSVNKRRIASGEGTDVYVSLETDLVTGNILGIISPINPADVDYVYWREDGIRIDGLQYNGESFTDYFDAEYLQSSQIPHADDSKITVVHFYPKTTGEHIPAYGGIISYSGGTLVWHYNNAGTYKGGVSFPDYIYGSGCGTLSRPIISSLSSEGVIAFAAVPEATSYKAYVYNLEYEKVFEQTVVNGGTINYHPYLTDTYKVYLQALGADDAYSAYSAPMDWALEGDIAYLPQSAYCSTDVSGYTNGKPVAFTWETVEGNIVITLSAASEPAAIEEGWHEDVQFRGGGMTVTNFKINGVLATDATFTKTVSGATLTLAPTANAVQAGDNITYDGIVEYKVAQKDDDPNTNTNDWPTLSFSYIYGTVCGANDHTNPVISTFTAEPITTNSVTFHVEASDETDNGSEGAIAAYSLSGNNGFVTTTVTPDGEGNFTIEGLTYNATYSFTLTVTDDRGNSVTSDAVVVTLPFNTELNLSLGRGEYCTASAVQNDHPALTADKAVDGNPSTFWTCYGQGETPAWWQVDLGYTYDVNRVVITFNDIAAPYTIYCSTNNSDWVTVIDGGTASKEDTRTHPSLVLSARYFKVTSANRDFGIKEFEVYGTAFSVADETAPTVSVTCPAKTINSATLQINAADLVDSGAEGAIAAINISGDHGFETLNNVTLDESNQITLEGLNYNTTYTFTVTAIDRARNEGSTNIEVVLPFNTEFNLAKNQPCTGGHCQFGDQTEEGKMLEYKKANDENRTTSVYSAYGAPSTDDAWWSVDLGAVYDLSHVDVYWASNFSTGYAIYGSLDNTNWYLIGKDAATEAGLKSTIVAAPAQYVKVHSYGIKDVVFAEVEVYASGFSTLTDNTPVLTYAVVGDIEDNSVTIEVGGVDITTAPVTWQISGIGESPIVKSAVDNMITIDELTSNTAYNITLYAKDDADNLSNGKALSFSTTGAAAGLFLYSDYFGWGDKDQARAQFSTTAESGVLSLTITNMTAGEHNFKLYNGTIDRCTKGKCGGESDHHIYNASAMDVTFYATSEDRFVCTLDELYLHGSLVGEDQTLVWNDAHTVATWTGTLDLSGTKQFTLRKKNVISANTYTYDTDFYTEAQTFDGDYTYGTFTLDITKMTGTWSYVALSFADDATGNSDVIAANNGRIANVTLNRSIVADNTWYTLCLPFDMSEEKVAEVFGGSQIAELTGSEDRGSLIHLNFDYVHAIEAGHAYLIKPGQNFTAGSTIEGVTIENVEPVVSGDELMHFQGTYNQTVLSDENVRFVADDDYLYSPADGGTTMGAFRCYFTIPEGSIAGAPGRVARIFVGEQVVTGIDGIQPSAIGVQKLLRDGQLLIIRDGRTYNAQGILVK